MNDESKTTAQLLDELTVLRRRVSELEMRATKYKQAEATLRQQLAEFEMRYDKLQFSASQAANDFTGSLHLVIGFAEVLEREYADMPDEERRRCVHTIVQSAHKAKTIFENLIMSPQEPVTENT